MLVAIQALCYGSLRHVTSWGSLLFRLACAIAACACLEATALAQGARPDVDQRARDLFEEGRVAYDAGDDEEALAHFKAAYELSHRPQLLYNIGLSADRLGRREEALAAYRGYLGAVPDAHNRVSVADRVRALEAMDAANEPPAQAPTPAPVPAPAATQPEPAPQEPPDEGRDVPIPPLIVAGAGVAIIGVGVAFGFSANSGQDDYASAPVRNAREIGAADATLADARSDATVANVLFAVGGAAVAAGAVWFALDFWGGSKPGAEASAWFDRESAGVRVRGVWGSARW